MRILRCQDGAALITALMLTMLALVIAMALLATVTTGTRISASQKRYKSALDAAQGGVELMTLELMPRLLEGTTPDGLTGDFTLISLQLPQYACLQQKLTTPTANWTLCNAAQSSQDPSVSPDVTFRLAGLPTDQGFSVLTKIVDSIPGNSDLGGNDLLDAGMGTAGRGEVIQPRHVPGMYNISVQGVREGGNSREKARLSLLYSY